VSGGGNLVQPQKMARMQTQTSTHSQRREKKQQKHKRKGKRLKQKKGEQGLTQRGKNKIEIRPNVGGTSSISPQSPGTLNQLIPIKKAVR